MLHKLHNAASNRLLCVRFSRIDQNKKEIHFLVLVLAASASGAKLNLDESIETLDPLRELGICIIRVGADIFGTFRND